MTSTNSLAPESKTWKCSAKKVIRRVLGTFAHRAVLLEQQTLEGLRAIDGREDDHITCLLLRI